MKSSPSSYCKLHFKCYMSIDFHVNGCSLWPDGSCKRHLCDVLRVTESVPSRESPEVTKELHMWPHLYSKSVGNQVHRCLVTLLLQYRFFVFALCYGKMTKWIPCSCLCKDSSHTKGGEKEVYLGAKQGGREGRRETWIEGSWDGRVYKFRRGRV